MTQLEQIIELGKLGYSKDEITALMTQPAAAPAQPVAAPAQPVAAPAQPVATPAQPVATPAPAPEPSTNNVDFLEALKLIGQQMAQPAAAPAPAQPVATPAPAPEPEQKTPSINLTAEDLVKLTQGIAVQTAAGSIETPRSANDIILGMLDAYESTTKKED